LSVVVTRKSYIFIDLTPTPDKRKKHDSHNNTQCPYLPVDIPNLFLHRHHTSAHLASLLLNPSKDSPPLMNDILQDTIASDLRVTPSTGPQIGELIALILTSAVHILLETLFIAKNQGQPATIIGLQLQDLYNILAAAGWSVYVLWRIASTPGILRAWGLRKDTFWPAMKLVLLFAIPAVAFLLLWGALQGHLPLPVTFWITCFLYPVWGIAQQFALQVFITRNLGAVIRSPWMCALVAALLFSLAHFPNGWLMGLVFPVGYVFSLIYQRRPNVWALGIIHGPLGALAYFCVLGQDPGARILQALGLM
jgi:membrane protease YdiL (CAAX protease family)